MAGLTKSNRISKHGAIRTYRKVILNTCDLNHVDNLWITPRVNFWEFKSEPFYIVLRMFRHLFILAVRWPVVLVAPY